jgi:hypothetical protein
MNSTTRTGDAPSQTLDSTYLGPRTYLPKRPPSYEQVVVRAKLDWLRWSDRTRGAAETLRVFSGVRKGDPELTERFCREIAKSVEQRQRALRSELHMATRELARTRLAVRRLRSGHAPRPRTNARSSGSRRSSTCRSSSDTAPGEPPEPALGRTHRQNLPALAGGLA